MDFNVPIRRSREAQNVRTLFCSKGGELPFAGGGFQLLGANAPGGLSTPFLLFPGDTLPALSYFTVGTPNMYGMLGLVSQNYALQLVDCPENPTGSGKALRWNYYGLEGAAGRAPSSWFGTGQAGASPCRFNIRTGLAADGRKPLTLYIHALKRWSSNYSERDSYSATFNIDVSGTSTSGTTRTVMEDSTKSWSTNEHAGKFLRFGSSSSRGVKIASNDGTHLALEAGFELGGSLSGTTYDIVGSWNKTTGSGPPVSPGSNAGTKGLFFNRIAGHFNLSGTEADIATSDNHLVNGWFNTNPGATGALTEGYCSGCYLQGLNWNGSSWVPGPNGHIPDNDDIMPYTPGDIVEEEYVLVMNTVPGAADGKFRMYKDESLAYTGDAVQYAQDTYRASSLASPYSGMGDTEIPLEEAWWDYLYVDATRGGGLLMPVNDMYWELLALGVAVSDSRLAV